jgi:hypothetical protein
LRENELRENLSLKVIQNECGVNAYFNICCTIILNNGMLGGLIFGSRIKRSKVIEHAENHKPFYKVAIFTNTSQSITYGQ